MSALATLDGVRFDFDPDTVEYTFSMKTASTQSIGGRVIQVYGTLVSRVTLIGSFAAQRSHGDSEAWQAQARFRRRVLAWATETDSTHKPVPLRLVYPGKNWDMDVFLAKYSSLDGDATVWTVPGIAPKWQLEMRVMNDRTRVVTKGLRDLYLKRLMDGVGWKQTAYNGPSEADVSKLLAGRTTRQFFSDEAKKASKGQPTSGTQAN